LKGKKKGNWRKWAVGLAREKKEAPKKHKSWIRKKINWTKTEPEEPKIGFTPQERGHKEGPAGDHRRPKKKPTKKPRKNHNERNPAGKEKEGFFGGGVKTPLRNKDISPQKKERPGKRWGEKNWQGSALRGKKNKLGGRKNWNQRPRGRF